MKLAASLPCPFRPAAHLLWLLLALHFGAAPAAAQLNAAGNLLMQHYAAQDFNTASASVWQIRQDSTGVLFMANNSGVLIFDGASWSLVPASAAVRSVAQGKDGRIYVGCVSDFGFLAAAKDGSLFFKSLKHLLPEQRARIGSVEQVFAAGEHFVYFYSREEIYRYDVRQPDKKLTIVKPGVSGQARFDGAFLRGGLPLAYRDPANAQQPPGFYRLHVDGRLTFAQQSVDYTDAGVLDSDALPGGAVIFLSRQGAVWLMAADGSLRQLPAEALPARPLCITALPGDKFAVGADDGLRLYNRDGSLLKWIGRAGGLPSERIFTLFAGAEGGLWAGHVRGLTRLQAETPVYTYDFPGSAPGKINDLVRYGGNVFMATINGVYLIEGNAARPVAPAINFEVFRLVVVAGRLVAATAKGLFDISLGTAVPVPGSPAGPVYDLDKSLNKPARFWAAHEAGAAGFDWDGALWTPVPGVPHLGAPANSVAEDRDGSVWVGTTVDGLAYFQLGSKPHFYNRSNGFLDGRIEVRRVRDRIIYLSAEHGYFTRRKDGRFNISPMLNTVKHKNFYPTLRVEADTLAIFTNQGVRRFIFQGKNKFVFDSASVAYTIHKQPTAILMDSAGMLAAYHDELALIGANVRLPDPARFRPLIRQVAYATDSFLVNQVFPRENGGYGFRQTGEEPVQLGDEMNNLIFQVAATSFNNEEGNRYRFLLEGYDAQYSPWQTKTEWVYANLPPGVYTLNVQAMNSLGQISPHTSTYSFKIARPWYWSPFVIAIAALAALAMIYTFVMLNERRLKLANKRLQDKVDQATRDLRAAQEQIVLKEKMSALGTLVAGIAHEMNSPLGAIKASSENVQEEFGNLAEQLPELFYKLPPESHGLFREVLKQITQEQDGRYQTSLEARRRRKALKRELESAGVPEAADVAEKLTSVGFSGEAGRFAPLFQQGPDLPVADVLYNFGLAQVNLDNILLAAKRTQRIVYALKTYAHSNPVDEKSMTNLNEDIDTVLVLYMNQLKGGVDVEKDYRLDHEIPAFPDELNQVWTNLVQNAIHAMEGQGLLELRTFANDEWAVVKITDNGKGIPPRQLDKIFEPFFTTKGKGEGTGLGLNICKRILDKHGGDIEVESADGKTTFTVRLPLQGKLEQGGAQNSLPEQTA